MRKYLLQYQFSNEESNKIVRHTWKFTYLCPQLFPIWRMYHTYWLETYQPDRSELKLIWPQSRLSLQKYTHIHSQSKLWLKKGSRASLLCNTPGILGQLKGPRDTMAHPLCHAQSLKAAVKKHSYQPSEILLSNKQIKS